MSTTEREGWIVRGVKKPRYSHEWVMVFMPDEEGRIKPREAVSMSELASALAAVGQSSAFEAYRLFEEMLWEQHEQQLADLDKNTTFSDSYDEPADYKREYAKHLLAHEFKQSIVEHRESLLAGAQQC